MIEDLAIACRQGQLTDISFHFASLIKRLDPLIDDSVVLAAALTSSHSVSNQVCLDLSQFAGKSVFSGINGKEIVAPQLSNWIRTLRESRLVATNNEYRPLVLERNNYLYLYRYLELEKRLAALLSQRTNLPDFEFDADKFEQVLSSMFPSWSMAEEQREFARLVVRRPFVVVNGGPGTGKTTTMVQVLAILLEMQLVSSDQIVLSAPTGKAATRLLEVVAQVSHRFKLTTDQFVFHSSTVHRLLGWNKSRRLSSDRFRQSIPYKLVVVDEASMVDLKLMTDLLERIGPRTRLILLGDKSQLTSVGVGSVLGDICSIAQDRALPRFMVSLRNCRRFSFDSQIGHLAKLVTKGDVGWTDELLRKPRQSDVIMRSIESHSELSRLLEKHCIDKFVDLLQLAAVTKEPDQIFKKLSGLKLLTAHRVGPRGVDQLNYLVEEKLATRGFVPHDEPWYIGRPVLIKSNDYDLQLFNGDIGIALPEADASSRIKVVFPKLGGGWRRIHPSHLPDHQTVYAMTIHKSQGSEYEHVIMVLPEAFSSVLSRELIYTAITRATKKLEVWGSKEVLEEAILSRSPRPSGLQDQLLA